MDMPEDIVKELLRIAKENANHIFGIKQNVAKIEGSLEHIPDGA
jgi:hypothetical protein